MLERDLLIDPLARSHMSLSQVKDEEKQPLFSDYEYREMFMHMDRQKAGHVKKSDVAQFLFFLIKNKKVMMAKSAAMHMVNSSHEGVDVRQAHAIRQLNLLGEAGRNDANPQHVIDMMSQEIIRQHLRMIKNKEVIRQIVQPYLTRKRVVLQPKQPVK